MKTKHLSLIVAATMTLLVASCFTSRQGTKGGKKDQTVMATEDPFANTNEVTINFKKYKDKDWHYPLEGAKVISPYGGKRPNHKGTDLKTKAKDKVRAAFKGVVTFSGEKSGYGNVVYVSHPNGLETRYAHNVKNIAKKGDKVKPGDVLALEGRTGNATTEHVHFETRIGGQAFDSELIFDHKKNTLRHVKLTAKKSNGSVDVSVKK
ncbi:MAG: M23 family metallopeptidase [Bacteroidaceae bacterium]|nr:M23 family metallopeptidase [Bacteroidaceae bacterium]